MDGHVRHLMVLEGTALEFVAGLLGGMPGVWGTPACSRPRAPGLAAGAAITHKLSVRQVRAAFTVLMLIAA